MKIDRVIAHAPRTQSLAQEVAELNGPCIGCPGCRGLCAAVIETLALPDAILNRGKGS